MGYTNSPLVVYTKLSPNHSGQRTHSIDRITPHCVVGQLSAESICGCFTSTSRQASCNYGIGTDGRVSLCVKEKNRSWCSSSNANDQRAVTIECASDMNEPYAMNSAVYDSLVKLCIDICKRNGKKKGQLNSDLLDGWTGGNITRIVRAERYMGAVLIQKKFTSDYLTHEVRDNKGEVPQYFVRNHHPAIVDEDLFEKAQEVVKVNSDLYNRTRSGKKPRAFSQRLICGECGRFFHVTNGNGNYPIWRCPTSSRTTGKRICHAEKVYEEQVVRAFRKAVLERFRLTLKPIHDNVAVADIMSGRFKEQYDNFTPEADSFVSQMLARLESIQKLDFMERDRAFYKKQIAAAHTSVESTSKKIRLLKSQVDVMQTRLELLGDEMIDPASIEEKKKLIEKLECDIQKDTDTEQKLTEQLDYMEDYWEELEGDYERREKAIEWMKNLPAGRDGTVAFLNEVTEEHCKAFLLSITIHSPLKFTVHWFDDTKTEVEMDSNIEDYRNTASYYDGHTMRDGSQRKRHVR